MIIFYSGEENRSLPEFMLPQATIMLTYWIHCRGRRPSSRYRRVAKARRKKYPVQAKAS